MASVQMFALIILTVLSSGSALRLQNRESEAPDLWEKLWDGMDMDPEEERHISQLFRRQVSGEEGKPKQVEHIEMLGPPDSGTHLLNWMLRANFPERVGNNIEHVWKHSLGKGPKDGAEQIADTYEKDYKIPLNRTTLFLSTRSPVAQLMSWHNNGYSLVECTKRDLDQWDAPCFAHTSPWKHDSSMLSSAFHHNSTDAFQFSSTMAVYNAYIRQYRQLQQLGRFKKVILLPMEDVVLTPKETFEMVAKNLGWSLPEGGVKVLEGKAKKFDGGYGRQKALEKLSARPFLELAKLSDGKSAVPKICKGIDFKAIKGLTEGSFTDKPRPYYEDCKGVH